MKNEEHEISISMDLTILTLLYQLSAQRPANSIERIPRSLQCFIRFVLRQVKCQMFSSFANRFARLSREQKTKSKSSS